MSYQHWKVDDLPWAAFDPAKVDSDHVKLAKAAALVEYNGHDYAAYLGNVFADDPELKAATHAWALEEVQHGEALGRWAQAADPSFDFEGAFKRFREGYQLPLEAKESVRGSRSGELLARCIVETATSSYYAALGEAAQEPVFKAICQRIATDELRHYKLFYTHLRQYLDKEALNRFERIKLALGRVQESEDDELAYAYYAANGSPDEPYDREKYGQAYLGHAYKFYRPHHVERGVGMIFKACGLKPHTPLQGVVNHVTWWLIKKKVRQTEVANAA
ncbi:MAG: ferritin-like domain-containing protein [Alphaproteobacteria bacterium]